mmetsp:Transcript_4749/g.16698  ORF Transcript_4749/g.16698 Transcript_4749/m.16698 type:complete len:223 (-) Transcript_4749:614-1282(-)
MGGRQGAEARGAIEGRWAVLARACHGPGGSTRARGGRTRTRCLLGLPHFQRSLRFVLVAVECAHHEARNRHNVEVLPWHQPHAALKPLDRLQVLKVADEAKDVLHPLSFQLNGPRGKQQLELCRIPAGGHAQQIPDHEAGHGDELVHLGVDPVFQHADELLHAVLVVRPIENLFEEGEVPPHCLHVGRPLVDVVLGETLEAVAELPQENVRLLLHQVQPPLR